MKRKVNNYFSNDRLSRYADSLRMFGTPEATIKFKTDSLTRKREQLLRETESRQVALQRNVSKRYAAWTMDIRKRFNLDSAGVRLPDAPNPSLGALSRPLPASGIPGQALPKSSLPDLPSMPSLQAADFQAVPMSEDLKGIGGDLAIPSTEQISTWRESMPTMPDISGEVGSRMAELKSLKSNPGETAEKAVMQVAEMDDATRALKEAEQLKQQNEALDAASKLQNPESAKEAIQELAVDHFQGQQGALDGAMAQMAKYKKKYASIGSLSDIPKNDWIPRNSLKGKPFRERFRPGMNLGFRLVKDTLLLDFYPNASYQISGRFEAGLGGIYRVRVAQSPLGLDQTNPVFGIASFVVFKSFKSVFLRLEVDGTSNVVVGGGETPTYRDWRWAFYTGIQTNFKLSKRWTGNVQMLYGFDKNLKDGFPEYLTARIGVQYKLK